jgi:DNA invertase Pin-like site-specific DNA recombinase
MMAVRPPGTWRCDTTPRAAPNLPGDLGGHHDVLAVIGAVGQAEREAMLERQREGIAKAKAQGRYKGRVPTVRRQAA